MSKNREWGRGLAVRIKAARDRLGVTQAELAEKLGVNTFTVSRWERGETSPSFEQMCRLSQVCGVSLHWLGGIPPTGSAGGTEEGSP